MFSALLGGITEIYCICAFQVLFYTHWEIIFATTALFCTILSGLIYSIGLTRLNISYSREEIIINTKKKTLVLSIILSVFPLTFLLRILDFFIPTKIVWIIAIVLIIVLAIVFYSIYQKKVRYNKQRDSY